MVTPKGRRDGAVNDRFCGCLYPDLRVCELGPERESASDCFLVRVDVCVGVCHVE